jgi:hypothetical protein
MKPEMHSDKVLARRLRKEAENFSRQPLLMEALQRTCEDPRKRSSAISDPKDFLLGNGLNLPDGLAFELFDQPPRYLPFPDWTPFVIELSQCRTFWVIECDDSPQAIGMQRKCNLKEEHVCFGYRIYPQPWPNGPFTL